MIKLNWFSLIKEVKFRNKHTGNIYTLVGIDYVKNLTVYIFEDQEGKKVRVNHNFVERNFEEI